MVGALNCSAVYDDDQCIMANACCEQQCAATSMVTSTCDYPAGCVCSEPDGTPSNLGGIIAGATVGFIVLVFCIVGINLYCARKRMQMARLDNPLGLAGVMDWAASSPSSSSRPSPTDPTSPEAWKPGPGATIISTPGITIRMPFGGASGGSFSPMERPGFWPAFDPTFRGASAGTYGSSGHSMPGASTGGASYAGGSTGGMSAGGSSHRSRTPDAWTARHVVQFDQLRFLRQLGQGSFGAVALADWRGTQVAVKVLHSADAEGEESFMQEAQLMDQVCNHPNVLRLLGVCLQPKRALIFPFYDLGSMEDLLVKPGARNQRSALPWHVVIRMLIQAAAGVHHLHQEGTIHRDLALRNLLVNAHYEVAVADFGMSRVKDSARGSGFTSTRIGPIKWEAPEVLSASTESGKPYSEATDVFSFGMCMWEAAAGCEPWPGLSPVAAGMKALAGERNPIPVVFRDATFASLIRECWAQSPADRPTMGNLLARLRAHFESGLVPRGTVAEVTGVATPPLPTGSPSAPPASMGGASRGTTDPYASRGGMGPSAGGFKP